jgi:hypothetical protein
VIFGPFGHRRNCDLFPSPTAFAFGLIRSNSYRRQWLSARRMPLPSSGNSLALCAAMAIRANDGSTLVEVLVATLVLVTGVLGVAQLFLIAAATNAAARDTTIATTLAAQKVEQLLSTDPAEESGLIDHVDRWGQVVGTAESPPANAVYTRRWSLEPLSAETVVIRVRVGRSDRVGGSGPMAGETRVLAVKPRPRS